MTDLLRKYTCLKAVKLAHPELIGEQYSKTLVAKDAASTMRAAGVRGVSHCFTSVSVSTLWFQPARITTPGLHPELSSPAQPSTDLVRYSSCHAVAWGRKCTETSEHRFNLQYFTVVCRRVPLTHCSCVYPYDGRNYRFSGTTNSRGENFATGVQTGSKRINGISRSLVKAGITFYWFFQHNTIEALDLIEDNILTCKASLHFSWKILRNPLRKMNVISQRQQVTGKFHKLEYVQAQGDTGLFIFPLDIVADVGVKKEAGGLCSGMVGTKEAKPVSRLGEVKGFCGPEVPEVLRAHMIEGGRGGVMVRQLVSHQGEPGSIPGGVAPGFSLVGIVPDDAASWRVFSGIYRPPPRSLYSGAAPFSPHFTLIGCQDLDVKSRSDLSTVPYPLADWRRALCLFGHCVLRVISDWLSCLPRSKLPCADWRTSFQTRSWAMTPSYWLLVLEKTEAQVRCCDWIILTITRCRCLPAYHVHSMPELSHSDRPSQAQATVRGDRSDVTATIEIWFNQFRPLEQVNHNYGSPIERDRLDFKHLCFCIAFVIGLQFVRARPVLLSANGKPPTKGWPNHVLPSQTGNVSSPMQKPINKWHKRGLLASQLGEPGSILGGVAPGISHVGIVPDDAAGWVFSGISRLRSYFIPALVRTRLASPSSTFKTSLGDRDMRINSLVASTRKAPNWRAVWASITRLYVTSSGRRPYRYMTEMEELKKWGIAVLETQPFVLREYVYIDALGRLDVNSKFPAPRHSIIWGFMGITGLLSRCSFQPASFAVNSLYTTFGSGPTATQNRLYFARLATWQKVTLPPLPPPTFSTPRAEASPAVVSADLSNLQTRLYRLMYKYAGINCALVVCCDSGRRRLGQRSPRGVKHHMDQRLDLYEHTIEEMWEALNNEVFRADEDEARWIWSTAGNPRENLPTSGIIQYVSHM
ncbi:hypothetical protein PR048_007569 [Dryococelus australis]|uniref:Uncharacterized protein n=1 Tax=Dryococelus australis TaxID=614101 RepID=A0ABQ9HV13_9NEOP|nr:hypothetical protein PR048_007569 [Dryococelus australis]